MTTNDDNRVSPRKTEKRGRNTPIMLFSSITKSKQSWGEYQKTCETNPSLALDEEFLHLNVARPADGFVKLWQNIRLDLPVGAGGTSSVAGFGTFVGDSVMPTGGGVGRGL